MILREILKIEIQSFFVLLDEGGFRKDGQNCIYRGNQCSFEGTIPETVDTAHVDIGNINMFDGEAAFRPLLEMRVRDQSNKN